MSIALSLAPTQAIGSYGALIDEIRDLMDDDGYAQDKIDRAIRKAEATFEREIRAPDMEATAILTATTELTALPADFLEMRAVWVAGDPTRTLQGMSPATRVNSYRGLSGCPEAYSIEGQSIRLAPVGNASLEMIYYQQIPPLSDANPSNWLLRKHPDLYVAGVMYYLAIRERDSELEAASQARVLAFIDSINDANKRARWGGAPLVPQGVMQVRGARA